MEALIGALFETNLGLIVLGVLIIGAIVIEFFNNKPKT